MTSLDESTSPGEVVDWNDDPWDPLTAVEPAAFETVPRQRRWLRWGIYAGAVLALAGLIAAGVVAVWYARQINPPGGPGATVTFVVDEHMSLHDLSQHLEQQGIITSASVFRFYVDHRGGLKLHTGYYQLRVHDTMGRIAAILETPPSQTYTKVTFPEGFTLRQMATRLATTVSRVKEADVLAAASSGLIRSRYEPPGVANLEGLLFPDTYQVAGTEAADSVVKRMVGLMDRVAAQEGIDQAPDRLGVTPYQVLVIASIIEREAKVDADRAKIARVIYNRLHDGMALQIDSTVLYAAPPGTDKVTQALIASITSPYNTYKVAGLPPTPIAMPGRASIHAALNPADGTWRYYVLISPDGHHAFATTQAEHQKNVELAKAKGLLP